VKWENENTHQWPVALVINVPKNCKRTILVQLIVEDVVTCFLGHIVVWFIFIDCICDCAVLCMMSWH